jgi:hypothetical membrane protein
MAPRTAALAAFGIAAHIVWFTTWMVESFRAPDYDWVQDQISALAADGASTASVMIPAFVVLGLGTIAQGFAVHRSSPRTTPPELVIAAGVSAVAAGVFRCDPGCPGFPDGSWHNVLHQLAVVGYFAPLIAAMLLTARAHWDGARRFAQFSLACGIVAGSTFLVFESLGHDDAVGGIQRASVATLSAWSVVVATRFLLARRVRAAT